MLQVLHTWQIKIQNFIYRQESESKAMAQNILPSPKNKLKAAYL
jgi:hypothetical protein